MACFTACVAQGCAVHLLRKYLKKTNKAETLENRLQSLQNMLFGGSALLLLEHIWHGEISYVFPFFTKATTTEGIHEIFEEIMTVGVGMDVIVTSMWGLSIFVSSLIARNSGEKSCA
ncbi:hypothetical protein [Succinivibrio dextrinosolvens]|uniref:Uncharacterized protein n=1 Tax=Succinivibrio dextrinosolvens TaxID=83771 RepID=A0A662Z9I8_9GAMM|nr:hypothetical protein [Succinivibrio dextrinosolvens]SFK12994.1 hypothetical protein SAMN04487865_102816 [Succinivibrio dextrinosolvens]